MLKYKLSLKGQVARLLRLLATNYIFREVAPDVFAHNRISIQMDTGKSFAELNDKYEFSIFPNLSPC